MGFIHTNSQLWQFNGTDGGGGLGLQILCQTVERI